VIAELLADLGRLDQRGRAYVGAVGEAEEQHHHLAAEVRERYLLAGARVGERERLAVVRAGDVGRLESGRFLAAAGKKAAARQQRAKREAGGGHATTRTGWFRRDRLGAAVHQR